ncbi:hypothetical protein FB451DRAFT_1187208 [Mycena latifolia]|nr:hypothetical protein FB451DRAFT_1187208 [Mycena latifolia]
MSLAGASGMRDMKRWGASVRQDVGADSKYGDSDVTARLTISSTRDLARTICARSKKNRSVTLRIQRVELEAKHLAKHCLQRMYLTKKRTVVVLQSEYVAALCFARASTETEKALITTDRCPGAYHCIRLNMVSPPLRNSKRQKQATLVESLFVKGYDIDDHKIKANMGALDWQDTRIDRAFRIILELVVRNAGLSAIVTGSRPGATDRYTFKVVLVGDGDFGDDQKELEEKDVPMPDYLKAVQDYISGPEVLYYVGD